MNDEQFTSLALEVLAGQASDENRKELELFLEKDSSARSEFEKLKETFSILQASETLRLAMDATAPALPAYRMRELQAAVRKEFPSVQKSSAPTWWKFPWFQVSSYASCALAVLLVGGVLLNHRSGIEFGTYTDSGMRNGLSPEEIKAGSIQSFASDEGFQTWQASRFGPKFRIWFDEANDKIMVVESGGLFSANKTSSYPLPAEDAEREAAVKDIITRLNTQK